MIKNLSPHTLISLCCGLCLIVAASCIILAINIPWLGITIAPNHDNNSWIIVAIHSDSPNQHASTPSLASANDLSVGMNLIGVQVAEEFTAFSDNLTIEEPDVLETYAAYNQLMRSQTRIATAAQKNQLALVTADHKRIAVMSSSRPLSDLPALFWFQLCVGVGGALTGALVWSSRRLDPAATLYALTGLGYLIFAPSAAIYSTRELILDGEIFRILSAINHFGALFFTASLTNLLWRYPHNLGSNNIIYGVYFLALLVWLIDVFQLVAPAIFHLSVLIIFATSFVFAFVQWRKTKHDPVGRAALRWFLLAIYTATGLFSAVIIIPAALHVPPPASQGIMFGAFLLMYWGLALGIVRYRLFSLEQWWYSIMAWFLGGLCVVVFDVLLIASVALPQDIALPLAVAATGWLYFPLRQKLWEILSRHQHHHISDWLSKVLPLLIDVDSKDSSYTHDQRWMKILSQVWQTDYVTQQEGSISVPQIIDDGLTLLTPSQNNNENCHYKIHCPLKGERLFNAKDIKTLSLLEQITRLSFERIEARNIGASQERERIRRDIHDDLGARLLTLLHSSSGEQQALIKEALQDTRRLVATLDPNSVNKILALNTWHTEIQQRCDFAGVELNWLDANETLPDMLSSRQNANIGRILREAISNSLKHASPRLITIQIQENEIVVTNDGNSAPREQWINGNGCRIMDERAQEINARISWNTELGCSLKLVLSP
jgi:signal transduction histidine kinase